MADTGHNPKVSEPPASSTEDVRTGPGPVPPPTEPDTVTRDDSLPPSILVMGRVTDPPTLSSSSRNTEIVESQSAESLSASGQTAQELDPSMYLEQVEPSASFIPITDFLNDLPALPSPLQNTVLEETQSTEPQSTTEQTAEEANTNMHLSQTVSSASSDSVASIQVNLPAPLPAQSTRPEQYQLAESSSTPEGHLEESDTIAHIPRLEPSSSVTSATVDQNHLPPSPPPSQRTAPEESQPALPLSAAEPNQERVSSEPAAPSINLGEVDGGSANSSRANIRLESSSTAESNAEQVLSELPATATDLGGREDESATSPSAYVCPTPLPVPQPEVEQVHSEPPTTTTDFGGRPGENAPSLPARMCLNCGQVTSPSYPLCDCPLDTRPPSSEGRAASGANFSFVDSEPERIWVGYSAPRQFTSANPMELRPPPDEQPEPVVTEPPPLLVAYNAEPAEPAMTDAETTEPSLPVDARDAEPTMAAAETIEPSPPVDIQDKEPSMTEAETGSSHQQVQPESSPNLSKLLGHSAHPSSSAVTSTGWSPLSAATYNTSQSGSSSGGSTYHACGCHEFGQGQDRRKVLCPAHDPNMVESLQSALENTASSSPSAEPSTDSETDPRPHLLSLATMAQGERHPPVVSADPDAFLDNLPLHDLSPPPDFNENSRGVQMPSEEAFDQPRATAAYRSGLLAPPPTNAALGQVQDARSAQNSLDTQRSPPPTFNEATQVSRPPGYMRMRHGDEYVAGHDSAQIIREERNARIRRGDLSSRECADFCGDSTCGCRFCGAMVDNIMDTCALM